MRKRRKTTNQTRYGRTRQKNQRIYPLPRSKGKEGVGDIRDWERFLFWLVNWLYANCLYARENLTKWRDIQPSIFQTTTLCKWAI